MKKISTYNTGENLTISVHDITHDRSTLTDQRMLSLTDPEHMYDEAALRTQHNGRAIRTLLGGHEYAEAKVWDGYNAPISSGIIETAPIMLPVLATIPWIKHSLGLEIRKLKVADRFDTTHIAAAMLHHTVMDVRSLGAEVEIKDYDLVDELDLGFGWLPAEEVAELLEDSQPWLKSIVQQYQ